MRTTLALIEAVKCQLESGNRVVYYCNHGAILYTKELFVHLFGGLKFIEIKGIPNNIYYEPGTTKFFDHYVLESCDMKTFNDIKNVLIIQNLSKKTIGISLG